MTANIDAEPDRAARRSRSSGRAAPLKFPKRVDSGWGGEAFGKGKAAMTIEGNWIEGALKSDYPNVKYAVYSCPPARPARAR